MNGRGKAHGRLGGCGGGEGVGRVRGGGGQAGPEIGGEGMNWRPLAETKLEEGAGREGEPDL